MTAPRDAFVCHRCGKAFPRLAPLRVHAIVDERRAVTAEERAGSAQTTFLLEVATRSRQAGATSLRQQRTTGEEG